MALSQSGRATGELKEIMNQCNLTGEKAGEDLLKESFEAGLFRGFLEGYFLAVTGFFFWFEGTSGCILALEEDFDEMFSSVGSHWVSIDLEVGFV